MAGNGNWLEPKPAQPLTGSEAFGGSGLSVLDFWRWAFSDLRENIVRGVFAEFLVARAVGDPSSLRHAWDNFDVTTPDGITIEVKSSAYLQSWRQRGVSRITFSGLTGRAYSYDTNEMAADPSLRADLYVFALHTCQDPSQYDVLDLDSWEFYVVPVSTLREAGSPKSISKAFLDRLDVTAVPLPGLRDAVAHAAHTS
jgi:hypothetical protein